MILPDMSRPTPSELALLRELAAGGRNRTIAAALGKTVNSVRVQIGVLMSKAGVSTRAALIAHAMRKGWVE
jgi:DNA-binding NarL/FixJ family response regulator